MSQVQQQKYYLFIDDERFPSSALEKRAAYNDCELVIMRDAVSALSFVELHGNDIVRIDFDHDLGPGPDANWLVNEMIQKDLDMRNSECATNSSFFNKDVEIHVHSQNPIGGKLLKDKLARYIEFCKE